MNIGKLKIDNAALLKAGATVVGIAGMLLSNVVASNEQKKMKMEIEEDLLKKLSKGGN